MVADGQNISIVGYDGYSTKDYDSACMDDSRPFGHELVVACMLQNLKPWENWKPGLVFFHMP
jgi:hypothetical protein